MAGQTAGPIGMTFFVDTHKCVIRCYKLKINSNLFFLFQNLFFNFYFQRATPGPSARMFYRGWMNVLPDYNPWQININPDNTKLSQQKTTRFDPYNPIMPWGQKIFKKYIYIYLLFVIKKSYHLLLKMYSQRYEI